MIRRIAPLVLLVLVTAAPAAAQVWQGDAPRRGSLEIGGGIGWVPSTDFGEQRAEQTRNPTTGSEPFDVFAAERTLAAAAAAQAHVAFYLSRAISLEGGFRYARPQFRVRLSDDVEEAEPLTATEDVSQYQFEGSLVLHLTNLAFASGRAVPFVIGGAGYIRDLHQDNELVETGSEFHGGGGLKWWLGSGPRRWGLRFEARATSREGGFDLGDERRTIASASVGLAYVF